MAIQTSTRHVRGILELLSAGALATACGSTATTAPTPTPPPARLAVLRMDVPGDPDVLDVPWLMAIDSLRDQGYTIETTAFDDIALPIVALEQGTLDAAGVSNLGAWAAIADGAPIVTVMDVSSVALVVVAAPHVQECADLNGKRLAVGGLTGVSTRMVEAYLARHCPEARAELLVISGSSNRRAGLLAGELDAALLPVDALIQLQAEAADGFHALVSLSQEFPGLTISSLMIHRSLAETYPATVRDLIRTEILVRRRIQDVQVLSGEIVKHLDMEPGQALSLAELYLNNEVWDANGGYTRDGVQANIDFLAEGGDLPADLLAEDVADLSYLNAVLDEIGRQ